VPWWIVTEAPLCHGCGSMMVRADGGHRCLNCGKTSGVDPASGVEHAKPATRDPPLTVRVEKHQPRPTEAAQRPRNEGVPMTAKKPDPKRRQLEEAVDHASERCQRARVSLRLRERDFNHARERLERYDAEREHEQHPPQRHHGR
jgi:DNA-directed RNA polymerase subunit M/transcription elongation factor TFIIS